MSDAPTALVVVNPCAGQGAAVPVNGWGHALAPRYFAECVTPDGERLMVATVREAVARGVAAVVIAGGDGSVNRVAHVLADTGVPLGIVPRGTGNDFAQALGIPLDPAVALARAVTGQPRPVDLLEINGQTCCTVGLLGVVAESAASVIAGSRAGSPWRPMLRLLRNASWRASGTAHLVRPWPILRRLRMTWTDAGTGQERSASSRVAGCFLANTRRLGGGLTLPVAGRPDDGVFEICVVRAAARVRLIAGFACLVYGRPIPRGLLDVLPARRASFEFDAPGPCSADGELLASARRFEVTVRPGALRVLL